MADPTCGEKYYAQYVAADCGAWCGAGEVGTALSQLRNLKTALIQLWNRAIKIEDAAGEYPVTDLFRSEHDAWLARDEFPAEYEGWESLLYDERETFDRITNVARDGACLLDRFVTQLQEHYPEEEELTPPAPYVPPPEPDAWDNIADAGRSLMTIAAVVAVSWFAYQVWDRATASQARGRRG